MGAGFRGELDWCLSQSFLLHLFYANAFNWFALFFAARPLAADRSVAKAGSRGLTFVAVSALSSCFALSGLWFRPVSSPRHLAPACRR